MKKIVTFWAVLMLLSICAVHADNIKFTSNAPETVAMGDQFRLSFTISTQSVRDFKAPAIKDFDVLMGPSRSEQRSTQMINGHSTSTSSITFTYILMPKKEGNFTIPGATATVDGEKAMSNSVKIRVIPADKQAAEGSASTSSSSSVSDTDLFITSTTSKTRVYEQEAVLLTYKIYAAVDLRGFDNVKLPDFKGFQSQEVDLPNERRWELEHYKGRNYRTTIYRQFVLFPQQAGEQSIDGARFDATVVKAKQISDPFDAFFNGGGGYTEIKKVLTTPKIILNVASLPSPKPEGYSGGVGEFDVTSSISAEEVKANEAVTVKLVISGVGNFKLLNVPTLKFPEEFETYDPKVENQFSLIREGLSGSQIIEYLAIPRNAGDFKIPSLTFSFFDTKTNSYKTVSTPDYQLHVLKGDGNASSTVVNYNNKEDLKVLNEDIRFIKQNEVALSEYGTRFFGTTSYWMYYVVLSLVFAVCFIAYRKQILANSDLVRQRNKKANKMAVKRLKVANKLMASNDKSNFYDEVLRALWGYVSDKLNIPVSQLTKDNISERLQSHAVDESLIAEFLQLMSDCEFERFAPANSGVGMAQIYEKALQVITKMEDSIV